MSGKPGPNCSLTSGVRWIVGAMRRAASRISASVIGRTGGAVMELSRGKAGTLAQIPRLVPAQLAGNRARNHTWRDFLSGPCGASSLAHLEARESRAPWGFQDARTR